MRTSRWTPAILAAFLLIGAVHRSPGDEPPKKSSRKASLEEAVAGADRLVIQPLDEGKRREETEIKGADLLRELLARIEIDEGKSGPACLCAGDHLLHFYKGTQRLGTLGHHHGVAFRWHDGKWRGDAALTEKAQEALPRSF